jgi:ribosomal protein S3AE
MAQAKRRKRFFDVDIPIIKKETQLVGYELKDLEGRIVKYDLTRMLKGKGALIQLEVKVKDSKAVAVPMGLKLLPYFLKRVIRKGTNYVEDSFTMETKNSRVEVKPLLVTRRKVSRAVRKALREKCREELVAYSKDKTSEDILGEILDNRLQKILSLRLKKIYPLSLCEIRRFKVVKDKQ